MILGDAWFSGKKSKCVEFGHCQAQLEYGEWKLRFLGRAFGVETRQWLSTTMTAPAGTKRQPFYRFLTRSHHKFTALHRRFYVDDKKRVTDYVVKHFSDISLAVWFMDDGSIEYNNGKVKAFKISAGGFSLEDANALKEAIFLKTGIIFKIYLEKKKYPCLKVSDAHNRALFLTVVRQYIHPSMMYKIQTVRPTV